VLVAAAVCPHPPGLVPSVSLGAAGDLAELRAACLDAVGRLAGARPDAVVVVGVGPARAWPGYAGGGLEGYGVAVPIRLDPTAPTAAPTDAPDADPLPPSIAIGAWLLAAAGVRLPRTGCSLPVGTPPAEAAALGARLVAGPSRTALLVLGDGSARRAVEAPGTLDARAAAYDGLVARALAAGDPGGLLALDPGLAEQLLVAGRAPWQALAGAAGTGSWRGELLFDGAPLGVGAPVAGWAPT